MTGETLESIEAWAQVKHTSRTNITTLLMVAHTDLENALYSMDWNGVSVAKTAAADAVVQLLRIPGIVEEINQRMLYNRGLRRRKSNSDSLPLSTLPPGFH